MNKLNCIRGFTLVELLITMGIAVVLGGVAMSNYFNYQSSITIDGVASELLGTLRDAQQRSISQDQQSAWGVYINAVADGNDYYELFSGANYSSGTVVSRTTLATDLKFIIPSEGSTKEVNYAKSTGLPNDNHTITITSVRNSSLFRTITINLSTGLIALEADLSSVPTIGSIIPNSALNSAPVNITDLSGTSFQSGASVKLTKSGQTDIVCTNVTLVSSQTLTCACDITGKATGSWNVVVTNPDAQSGSLLNGFTITSTTVPDSPTLTYITPSTDSAVLNWTAPASDGGSSITNYRIYRGTSAGAESFLTEIGNVLTYSDSNLTTGTNYYYKISAKNINGESVLSNELSVFIGSSRIFVTSTTYNGNLGGLSGADAKCQARADALSLGGTWKAWLSDETTSASSRLAHSTNPYVNMRGGIVANDWTGLTSGSLLAAIQYNESGVAASGQAWTGSYANGTSYFSQDCTAWTSTTGTGGDAGLSGLVTSTSGSWSFLGTNSCNTSLPLYCVEQLVPPSAPQNLIATPGDSKISLSWTEPVFTGSGISNYRIYRGDISGGETFLTEIENVLTYVNFELNNDTPYYYKVSAVNSVGEGDLSSEVVASPGVRRIFVTSVGHNGNFGGLSGADSYCQTMADNASLGGTWKAWLSDSATNAYDRLIHYTNPYVDMLGNVVANNWAGLVSGGLSTSLKYDEFGTAVSPAATAVHTNTYASGALISTWASYTCDDWTTGVYGPTSMWHGFTHRTDSTWSYDPNWYGLGCEMSLRLYCIEQQPPWTCGDIITDIDSNSYTTVQIGTQCWMAENMMTTKYPDGSAITRGPTGATWAGTDLGYYAYPPNTANTAEETLENIIANKLGFVYQWSAAMNGSTTAGAQGLCPTGWHIPTDAEWYTLENFLKDEGQTCDANRSASWGCVSAGTKLKSGGTSGFNDILAGNRSSTGGFSLRSSYALFWSSVEYSSNPDRVWSRSLHSGNAGVSRYTDYKTCGVSVRCLKD